MASESKGLLDSLGKLASTLIGITHTRLALLSSEIEEDRTRFVAAMSIYVVAAFSLLVGVVLAIVLMVYILLQQNRLLTLAIIATLFILIGVGLASFALYKLKTKPKLFSASLAELLKDKNMLESE
jgi:uncharacterized membrane protein YqjE